VVITTANARAVVGPCLDSLLADVRGARVPHEVIVVDDASADGTAEFVAAGFPDVTLIRADAPSGYAAANNIGIRAASGDAVLLLNADTVVRPGAVTALLAALDRYPRAAAVGPTLLNPDGSIQRSCWRFPLRTVIGNTLWLFRAGVWDDYRAWDHRADRPVDWVSSAALMIRRAAFATVGLLDERFWVYGVDIDWGLRARRAGYEIVSVAAARIVHLGGRSWGNATDRQYEDHMRSQALLFRLHHGRAGLILFHGLILLNSAARVLVWGLPSLLGLETARRKTAEFLRLARWSLTGRVGVQARAERKLSS
jgi:GT2 family glycosyltransferase